MGCDPGRLFLPADTPPLSDLWQQSIEPTTALLFVLILPSSCRCFFARFCFQFSLPAPPFCFLVSVSCIPATTSPHVPRSVSVMIKDVFIFRIGSRFPFFQPSLPVHLYKRNLPFLFRGLIPPTSSPHDDRWTVPSPPPCSFPLHSFSF